MPDEMLLDAGAIVSALQVPIENGKPGPQREEVLLLATPEVNASSDPSVGEVAGCPGGCFVVA